MTDKLASFKWVPMGTPENPVRVEFKYLHEAPKPPKLTNAAKRAIRQARVKSLIGTSKVNILKPDWPERQRAENCINNEETKVKEHISEDSIDEIILVEKSAIPIIELTEDSDNNATLEIDDDSNAKTNPTINITIDCKTNSIDKDTSENIAKANEKQLGVEIKKGNETIAPVQLAEESKLNPKILTVNKTNSTLKIKEHTVKHEIVKTSHNAAETDSNSKDNLPNNFSVGKNLPSNSKDKNEISDKTSVTDKSDMFDGDFLKDFNVIDEVHESENDGIGDNAIANDNVANNCATDDQEWPLTNGEGWDETGDDLDDKENRNDDGIQEVDDFNANSFADVNDEDVDEDDLEDY